ncbi:jg715 [Pararge aegeria aegeria]|uniref:Jg715 protein n=1 Tax=Pararge aegeria aegeria TaxID=348720 RepID=A0A8S4RDM1_9NEOP|nr:jg715 [Pararge aegeria aegeria]
MIIAGEEETYFAVLIFLLGNNEAVRLHNLFQFLDGYKSEHNLQGFLHIGEDYAVFLRKPKSHDKLLIYELYEAKNVENTSNKPRLLAISQVPVEYIKEQLKKYREELYRAKYVDNNVVPGTEVKTLREWQIDRALDLQKGLIAAKPVILRTLVLQ